MGVTVNTPPPTLAIDAAPTDPGTTVSTIGKAELAVGLTLKGPEMIARSEMAAKLTV